MGIPIPTTKPSRRRPAKNPHRRRSSPACKIQHNNINKDSSRMRGRACVSDKLEALKNLIPSHIHHCDVKPDQLFQQTADYILLLRNQISVLQQLVDLYGSSTTAAADGAQPADQHAV